MASKCVPPECSNAVKDPTETDVDCGGTCGPCAVDKGCAVDGDCIERVCGGDKKCAAPTKNDNVKNGNETDVDCGSSGVGTDTGAGPCKDTKACAANVDCESAHCVNNACAAPTCDDQIKNGGETDTDCGGSCTARCAATKGCSVNADCIDGICGGDKKCAVPTKNDGVKNGNETDVDCGSSATGIDTMADKCNAAQTCGKDVDCKSAGCNHLGRCAMARSCSAKNGGTTCGTGDASAAGSDNEDCCASATVPVYTNDEGYANTAEFRLDKYQITSGRIRRFLDSVQGNVQGWVKANRANIVAPNQLPEALDKYLPTGWFQPNSTDVCYPNGTDAAGVPCNYGAYAQVTGFRYNNSPGGDNGYACNLQTGGYGARTFYVSDAELADINAQLGPTAGLEIQHSVARDREEQKSMTCATYYILAAFCAWDGGRLETPNDYNGAYGGNYYAGGNTGKGTWYPWGNDTSTRPIGFASVGSHIVAPTDGYTPPAYTSGGANLQYSTYNANLSQAEKDNLLLRLSRANLRWNYGSGVVYDYRAPLENRGGNPLRAESLINVANDQTVAIAPPGRYPLGAGRYGHRDLLGNVIEIMAPNGTANVTTGNRPWARNGSYETAHFHAATMTYGGSSQAPLTKYGRAGGRCARPLAANTPNNLPATP